MHQNDPWTSSGTQAAPPPGISWRQRVLAVVIGVAVLAVAIGIGAQVSQSAGEDGPKIRAKAGATTVDLVAPGKAPTRSAASRPTARYLDGAVQLNGLSVVRSGPRATGTGEGVATATTTLDSLTILDGRVQITDLELSARTRIENGRAVARFELGEGAKLIVEGQELPITANKQVVIPEFGTISVNEQASVGFSARGDAQTGPRARLVGSLVHIRLSKDVGELGAGTSLTFGRVDASVRSGKVTAIKHPRLDPIPTSPPVYTPAPTGSLGSGPGNVRIQPGRPKPGETGLPIRPTSVRGSATAATGNLSGYLFPILGQSSYVDTWGAARASTGVPHQGTDIFAVEGTPMVAVADGVLDRVGWNSIGGYRFWLYDQYGNGFYYAHLSAFSPLARDGARVKAGDVIGFVGHTGDAQGTPPHLHFEVHPGNGPAVNPIRFLDAWRKGLSIAASDLGALLDPGGATGKFVPEGLVFLDSADIAATSGLSREVLEQVRSTATRPVSEERSPVPTDESLKSALDGNVLYTSGAQK